jgi:DNA invertase Pin-like site-specific DNA recombinase
MSKKHSTNGDDYTLRAGIYYRMSDDKQENSIDRQRSQVRPYCDRKGYAVVREYLDEGIAGERLDRPGFQKLLADAAAGLFSAVVVDEPSRLARLDPLDYMALVGKPLRDAGVLLDTVSRGEVRWDDIGSFIVASIEADKSSDEVKKLSRRVLSEMARLAAEGQILGKQCYGYRVEYRVIEEPGRPPKTRPTGLVPDEPKASVVRWLFRRYAEGGTTLEGLCRELVQRKAPPPCGKGGRQRKAPPPLGGWSRAAVWKILMNVKYLGVMRWNHRSTGKYHELSAGVKPRKGGPERENVPARWVLKAGTHEPLVDRETFDRVQARLADNAKGGRGENLGRFLFSGLGLCQECGRTLGGRTSRGKRYYQCYTHDRGGNIVCRGGMIAETVLLDKVIAVLDDALSPERREEVLRQAEKQLQADREPGKIEAARKALDELKERIAHGNRNLLLLPTDRVAAAVETLKEWEAERDRLAGELAELGTSQPEANLAESMAAAAGWLKALKALARRAGNPAVATALRDTLRAGLACVSVRWQHVPREGRRTRHFPTEGTVYLRSAQEQDLRMQCDFQARATLRGTAGAGPCPRRSWR